MDITIDHNDQIGNDELYVTISPYQKRPAYDVQNAQNDLTNARNLWDFFGIEYYFFEYQDTCFGCFPLNSPWTIQVSNDRPRAMDSNVEGVANQTIPTVPHLFDIIQDALDHQAFDIQVTYHEGLGFPTNIYIDYNNQIHDEELSLRVSAMNVLHNPRAQVVLAEAKWLSSGFTAYSYTYQEIGSGTEGKYFPWLVDVVNGQIIKITNANKIVLHPGNTTPSMINQYAMIKDALNRNAASVDVTYSPMHGYPVTISIDYNLYIQGDEKVVVISNFVERPGQPWTQATV